MECVATALCVTAEVAQVVQGLPGFHECCEFNLEWEAWSPLALLRHGLRCGAAVLQHSAIPQNAGMLADLNASLGPSGGFCECSTFSAMRSGGCNDTEKRRAERVPGAESKLRSVALVFHHAVELFMCRMCVQESVMVCGSLGLPHPGSHGEKAPFNRVGVRRQVGGSHAGG